MQLSDRPSLHHLPATHLSESKQQKGQRDIVGVGSVITECWQSDEDNPKYETPV